MNSSDYVLITPARNERANIEDTIHAVVSQTRLPLQWVIVSDGSDDGTDEIVLHYSARHPFIRLVRREPNGQPGFASKIHAFDEGYRHLEGLQYSFIGNLDGDVSFDQDYFESLIERMATFPNLGLCGGMIHEEIDGQFLPRRVSDRSIGGAVHFFRREVFEAIGGYMPHQMGGEDTIAVVKVRMRGWEVRLFPELVVLHHGRVTGGSRSVLNSRFRFGMMNYLLGYHPIFHALFSINRMIDRPYLIGGIAIWVGYCWAGLRRLKRKVSPEFIRFLRREQMERLCRGINPMKRHCAGWQSGSRT